MADKSDRLRGYVVISTTLEGTDYRGCKVIPYGEIYPAIYRQVFGPASEKECKQWVAKNCKAAATE
ncbi:MAG TPA: hypothetical protein VF736_06560 [Pyrinomonadaceae bacterium]|jgi:hypothetical protein